MLENELNRVERPSPGSATGGPVEPRTGWHQGSDDDEPWFDEANTELVMRRGEPWVRRIARSLVRRLQLGPDHQEELEAAGRLGLLEAHRKYDHHHPSCAKFSTFAYTSVRRHVHDAVSGVRNASQGLRRSAKRKAASARESGENPANVHTEDHLGCLLRLGTEGVFDDRFMDLERHLEGQAVRDAIERLPNAQQRQVVRLIYVHGREQTTVGQALGLGKSRVCQIQKAGLETLKKLLDIGSALDDHAYDNTVKKLTSATHRDVLESLYRKRAGYEKARKDLGLTATELEALHQTALREVATQLERGERFWRDSPGTEIEARSRTGRDRKA
ncbi:MAG: sigma-70 family RNA polymerase sigma factor [Polyangiales bacterium]